MGIFNWTKKASELLPIKLGNLWGTSEISPLRNTTDFLKIYSEDPYISRATSIIGNSVSLSNREVVDDNGDKIDHPILDLFDKPNKQGPSYFFSAAAMYIVLGGEVFWETVAPTGIRPPRELYNIRPDRMYLEPNEEKTEIDHYEFRVNGRRGDGKTFNPDEIVHIKTFHPTNDWRGMPACQPLVDIIHADKYGWEWIKDFLRKKGVLKGFLTSEKSINKSSAERLKDRWARATGSGDGTPLLPGGLDWKNIARPPKESGMVELNQHILESKLATIGVPKGLLGIFDTTQSSEDLDVMLRLFYSMTVTPYLRLIEDKINIDLMPRFAENGTFKFDPDIIGLLDFEELVDSLTKQFDRGALTPNQFADSTGIGAPYDGGDEHYLGSKVSKIGETDNDQTQE